MKYKKPVLALGIFAITFSVFLPSCKKINDATTLGGDLIPAVDNITTFDTTLEVEVTNGIFSLTPPDYDSIRLRGTETFFLGNITNDPVFGKSTGTVFTQLKPFNFPFSFSFKPDSLIAFDSVVLALKYINTYGDTTIPQTLNVYEIDQSSDFRYDSSYLASENHVTYSGILGSATFTPQNLNDSVHLFKEDDANQLRIKLDDAFGLRLLAYDSLSTGTNNAYYSDSAFNLRFKGFAIVPGGTGNALVGVDLANSKLSVYYRYKHGVTDTTVSQFDFTGGSASANYLQRDYSGSQLSNYQGTTPQDFAFIQTQPGTFSKINIPGLSTLSNRVIHRAELIVDQAYTDPLDNIFVPPSYLYLDAYDQLKTIYRAIPFDVTVPDASTSSLIVSNPGFGAAGKSVLDGANTVREWKFNISRYVQNVVMGKQQTYPLRLHAPYIVRNTFTLSGSEYIYNAYVNPAVVAGRVKVYGGDATRNNARRMRLRIVYSKL